MNDKREQRRNMKIPSDSYNMKIGITGGTGYIASHVALDLLDRGHRVLAFDDLSNSYGVPYDSHVLTDFSDRYQFLHGNLSNPIDVDAFLDFQPDVIFHFAGKKAVAESMSEPENFSENNIRGSALLLEKMAHKHRQEGLPLSDFIFSSSAGVYGEPQSLPLQEDHLLLPINFYGWTKLMIEQQLEWWQKILGLRYVSLRYFNAAGYDTKQRIKQLERQPANLIPILLQVLSGKKESIRVFGRDYPTKDGTCIRDYIHVNDLSEAHVLGMEYLAARKEQAPLSLIVNLGNATGFSNLEVIRMAEEVANRKIPMEFAERRRGDAVALVASKDLAEKELKWQPQKSDLRTILETSIRMLDI